MTEKTRTVCYDLEMEFILKQVQASMICDKSKPLTGAYKFASASTTGETFA